MIHRRAFLIFGAMGAGAVVSCTGKEDAMEPDKSGDGRIRQEREPLFTRLPQLSQIPAACWSSGILGDRSMPGPSTYWIDAVVTLDAATLEEVAALPKQPAALPDNLHPAVAREAPTAEYVSSAQLNEFFSHDGWRTDAYLAPEEGIVVLLIVGQ